MTGTGNTVMSLTLFKGDPLTLVEEVIIRTFNQ